MTTNKKAIYEERVAALNSYTICNYYLNPLVLLGIWYPILVSCTAEEIIKSDASKGLYCNKKILYSTLITSRKNNKSQSCKILGFERLRVRTII